MKSEPGLFGEIPSKQTWSARVPISGGLLERIKQVHARTLSEDTKHWSGGYQSTAADTAARVREGSPNTYATIEVDYLYIGRVFKCAYTRGGGGWEDMFKGVLIAIRKHLER